MPAPKRKQVSDEVFERITNAINVLRHDTNRPRTKREIERIAGLGHDAVARAFRQDATETNAYRINTQLDELTASLTGKRRSPAEDATADTQRKLADLRREITELNTQIDRYAMASYAYYLSHRAAQDTDTAPTAIPIGRNRARKN